MRTRGRRLPSSPSNVFRIGSAGSLGVKKIPRTCGGSLSFRVNSVLKHYHKISIAAVRITMQTTPRMMNSFAPNFNHVEYSTFASARPPMMAPLVGVNRFTRPLPALKIMIMTSGENPRLFAKGPMIGMDTVAMPEEDGMRNDSTT